MEGWCTHEKACNLFSIVYTNQLKLCVEIGTFGGKSMMAIALALKALDDGIVFGIDPWKVEPCLEGSNKDHDNKWWSQVDWNTIIASYFDKAQEFGVLGHMAHFRKHDTKCLQYFNEESIDLIHFDSNHSEEVACRTVNDWWGKIRSQGVIVMDDINWDGQHKAADLLKKKGVLVIKEYDNYGIYIKP